MEPFTFFHPPQIARIVCIPHNCGKLDSSMPSPTNLLDLVEFPDKTNNNFRAAMGFAQWWEHLEQGRLFLLTNYADSALKLGRCMKGSDLTRHAGPARNFITANRPQWLSEFPTPGWKSFDTNQLRAARYQMPMLLVKAAIAVVTLDFCIQSQRDYTDQQKADYDTQLYRDVRIVPALWRLEGFDNTVLNRMDDAQKEGCDQAILQCGVPRPRHILNELAAGHHITHSVALALQRALAPVGQFMVVTARRPNAGGRKGAANDPSGATRGRRGGLGNVKSACRSFCLP